MIHLLFPLLLAMRFFRAIRNGLSDPDHRTLFGTVLALLVIGTAFYHFVEDWSLINAFYLSVITLTATSSVTLQMLTERIAVRDSVYFF